MRHSLEALTLENPQEIPGKVTVHGFVSTRTLTQEKATAEETAVSKEISRLQYPARFTAKCQEEMFLQQVPPVVS